MKRISLLTILLFYLVFFFGCEKEESSVNPKANFMNFRLHDIYWSESVDQDSDCFPSSRVLVFEMSISCTCENNFNINVYSDNILCGSSLNNSITESSCNGMEPIIQKFEVIVNDNNKLTHDEYDFDVIINSNGFSEDIWPNPANYNPFWSEFVDMFSDQKFETDDEEILPDGQWLIYDDDSFESQMSPATIPLPNMGNGNMAVFWTRFTKPIEWQDYNLVIKKVKVFNKSGANLPINIVASSGSVFHHGYNFPTHEGEYGSWQNIYSDKVWDSNTWIEVETDKEINAEDFFVGIEHVEMFTFLIGVDVQNQSTARSGITTYNAAWNLFMGAFNDAEYGIRVYVEPIGGCN